MLCTSLVGLYDNITQKVFDLISQYKCITCKSKRLAIDSDISDDDRIVQTLFLKCEECNSITEVVFERNDDGGTYIKGKVVE